MPIKSRLQLYLAQTGATQTFVAESIGIPFDTLNRFITGKRPLPHTWYAPLDAYLSSCGY